MCEQEKESESKTRNNKIHRRGDGNICTKEKTILINKKSSTEHIGPSGFYIQVLMGVRH